MSDWQPIETAPKGKEVLVWKDGSSSHVVAIWLDQSWVSAWSHEPIDSPGFEPTHWMPLPEPPVSGTVTDAERADSTRRSESAKEKLHSDSESPS